MANPTVEWTKVLIHPLGLAGYVLFLVFGLVARAKRRDEKRWLFPAALAAGGLALMGALGLAYLEVDHQQREKLTVLPKPSPTPVSSSTQVIKGPITQKSAAPCNPNIVTAGNVTVTCSETSPQPKKQPLHDSKRPDQSQ